MALWGKESQSIRRGGTTASDRLSRNFPCPRRVFPSGRPDAPAGRRGSFLARTASGGWAPPPEDRRLAEPARGARSLASSLHPRYCRRHCKAGAAERSSALAGAARATAREGECDCRPRAPYRAAGTRSNKRAEWRGRPGPWRSKPEAASRSLVAQAFGLLDPTWGNSGGWRLGRVLASTWGLVGLLLGPLYPGKGVVGTRRLSCSGVRS